MILKTSKKDMKMLNVKQLTGDQYMKMPTDMPYRIEIYTMDIMKAMCQGKIRCPRSLTPLPCNRHRSLLIESNPVYFLPSNLGVGCNQVIKYLKKDK